MPSIYTIEPATADDLDAIVDFNVALAFESEQLQLDRQTVRHGVQSVLADAAKGQYFVARTKGDTRSAVAGQLMVTREWSDWRNAMMWWVQSVYVHPEHRRRGVFRSLFQHILDMARTKGVPVVRLYVEHDNAAARATYESLGLNNSGYLVLEHFLVGSEQRPSVRRGNSPSAT